MSHKAGLFLQGCTLKDVGQRRLWMSGEKWAEWSLLAELCPFPDPSSKALHFHLPAALCGGQVFVRATDGMLGCCVPLWLRAERSVSPCKCQASGRGVMAVEDLNLSALLMTLCWHQRGGIPFSLCCFWRRSKSWDFIQNLLKLSRSLGCVEFSPQKWRQWNPRWMLSWGYKTLNLLKFIILSMILWLCWKLWHKCWTEVSNKIKKHL